MTSKSISVPLLWSLVGLAVVVAVCLLNAPSVARAVLAPGLDEDSGPDAALSKLLEEYGGGEETYLARFAGRSVFFEPKQPPAPPPKWTPPPKPEREEVEVKPEPPKPRQKPAYRGPKLDALLGGTFALFVDGTRLVVGQEKGSLKLLDIDAPWGAKVEYNDWEYELTLYNRPGGAFFGRDDDDESESDDEEEVTANADGEAARSAVASAAGEDSDSTVDVEAGDDPEEDDPEANGEEELATGGDDKAEDDIPPLLSDSELQSLDREGVIARMREVGDIRRRLRRAGKDELQQKYSAEFKALAARLRELDA